MFNCLYIDWLDKQTSNWAKLGKFGAACHATSSNLIIVFYSAKYKCGKIVHPIAFILHS